MAQSMKAAVVRAYGAPLVIEEMPVPDPGPDQVVVRIAASGVCHTDLHAIDGDWPLKPRLPFVPGHEAAGFVAKAGGGVHGLREGDRVGVPWLNSACGTCELCLGGWETLCLRQQNTGYTVNGGFAEYVVAPAAFAMPLPAGPDLALLAPILCAGLTVYKGLKRTDARPGDWVLISGVGGTGHVAVQYAKAMGLKVAAVDVDPDKLELARQLGADVTVNAATEFPASRLQREVGGVHAALVTAVATKAVEQAVKSLRRGGTCVLVGIPPGSFATSVFDVVVKGLTIRGSIVGSREDLAEALATMAEGGIRPHIESRPLEEINTVLDRLRQGRIQGRVVLDLP